MVILTYAVVHISGACCQCGRSVRTRLTAGLVLFVIVGTDWTVDAAVTAAVEVCPSWTHS